MIRVQAVNITCVNIFRDNRPMDEMGQRLRKARIDAGFSSARGAALHFGWSPSTYAAHENGQNEFDPVTAERYAKAFKTTAAWLLTAEGPAKQNNVVRVMGLIGAGAEIRPDEEQVPPEGLSEVEVPFPIPDDAIAFEVQGQSMWPRYDAGDVIICWHHGSDVSEVLGWEAAVRTKDGHRYLKRIVAGTRKGLFDLESFNAPTIRNVRFEWVGRVQAVVRAGQWRQLNRPARAKIKQTLAKAREG